MKFRNSIVTPTRDCVATSSFEGLPSGHNHLGTIELLWLHFLYRAVPPWRRTSSTARMIKLALSSLLGGSESLRLASAPDGTSAYARFLLLWSVCPAGGGLECLQPAHSGCYCDQFCYRPDRDRECARLPHAVQRHRREGNTALRFHLNEEERQELNPEVVLLLDALEQVEQRRRQVAT